MNSTEPTTTLCGFNLPSQTFGRPRSLVHCSHQTFIQAEDILWHNADDLYRTIDLIQASNAPWKCYQFSYHGPKSPVPPQWTEETYELNTQDMLLVLLVFCEMTMGFGVILWFVY